MTRRNASGFVAFARGFVQAATVPMSLRPRGLMQDTSAAKPSLRSMVGWHWSGGVDCGGDWKGGRDVERVLRRAQDEDVVRDFGVGSCSVWFDASTGVQARAVRDRVDALVPKDWTRGEMIVVCMLALACVSVVSAVLKICLTTAGLA
jgi:hypothetical protein